MTKFSSESTTPSDRLAAVGEASTDIQPRYDSPVLLIEDTASLAMAYRKLLERAGYAVEWRENLASGREAAKRLSPSVVLLDLMLPDGDGLDLMRELSSAGARSNVIAITANGSVNRAVEAMREGAFDFLVKPFDERRLIQAVGHAAQSAGESSGFAEADIPSPAQSPSTGAAFGFVGSSEKIRDVTRMVRDVGRSTATVFITGESGTGKELCAQAIHEVSRRSNGPFVPLNCGAIPRDLLESEVFGHLKGSFTGAISDKKGAAAAADGGTLFLDEICEMDLSLQTKLLRFLQTSTIQPVGATRQQRVDVRILCATNRDPVEEVAAGRFRQDLFYRLHVVPIHLPPLRERGADVIEIARRFLAEYGRTEGRRFSRFDPAAEQALMDHSWPGNVRELQNVVRNIVVLNDGEEVTLGMLPPGLGGVRPGERGAAPITAAHAEGASPAASSPGVAPAQMDSTAIAALVGARLSDVESELIEATIRSCGGSIPKAARVLDVSPSTLYRKRLAKGGSET